MPYFNNRESIEDFVEYMNSRSFGKGILETFDRACNVRKLATGDIDHVEVWFSSFTDPGEDYTLYKFFNNENKELFSFEIEGY
jgi:hypothetical protein